MSYASIADLTTRFSEAEIMQLTDRDEVITGAIVEDRANRALDQADNVVNSYIGVRYALPLATVPSLVVDLACDIARFKLYDTAATDEVRKRYDDAMSMLKALAVGTAVLDIAGIEPEAREDQVYADTGNRVFTRDSMRGL